MRPRNKKQNQLLPSAKPAMHKEQVSSGTLDNEQSGPIWTSMLSKFKKNEIKSEKYSYWDLYKYADSKAKLCMVIGTLSGVLNGLVMPLLNLLIGQISNLVAEYSADKSQANIDRLYSQFVIRLILLGAIAVGAFIFGSMQTFFWSIAAERQTKVIREKYFAAIIHQDYAWFTNNPSGELTSRISSDVNQMYDGMAEKVGYIVQYTTSCVGGLILAFVTSWRLTLILFAVFPIPAIALNRMWNQVGINLEKVQEAYSKAGAIAIQAFRGIATVMINNGQKVEESRYKSFLELVRIVGKRIARINGLGIGVVSFFFMAVRTPVFYFGGILVLDGQMKAGDAIATFLQISSGVMYLGNILGYLQATGEAKGAAQKVFSIIDTKPFLNINSDQGIKPESCKGHIQFKNVTFSYPSRPDYYILKNFSLEIEAGQSVALVGSSGGGKSTILLLLMRIYDPLEGDIYLDGVNIKELNLLWLRETMSIVSQEPVLFDKTLFENIALGCSSRFQPTKEDVEQACEAANINEFLHRFPQKLDTRIMRGSALSGGQKQRIAIARAIVRKPSVLMLDEATSALDSRSERIVQSAIDQLSKNQTTIMIAHRLSTIRNVDKIVVIDSGSVAETGNHAELFARQGIYYHMIVAQDLSSSTSEIPGESSNDIQTLTSTEFGLRETYLLDLPYGAPASSSLARSYRSRAATENYTLPRNTEQYSKRPFPFRRVFELSKPDMKYVMIGLVGAICDGALVPLESYLMGTNLSVYGSPQAYGGKSGVLLYSLLFLPLATLSLFAKGLQQWGFGISGSNLTERLRAMVFGKLIRQDMYFFDKEEHSAGALSSALASDADAVKKIGGPLVGQILTILINTVLGFSIAFAYGWQLTLLLIGCTPLLFLATVLERKALEGYTEQTKRSYEESGQLASAVLSNIKTVVMLSKEKVFCEEYNRSLDAPHKIGYKKAAAQGMGNGAFQALLTVVFIITFLFCYYLLTNNILGFSNIIIVILNVILTAVASGTIVAQGRNIIDGKIGAIAIFDILDQKVRIDVTSPYGRKDVIERAEVEMRNIRFSFPTRPDIKVLKGVNIKINKGEKVALVGTSGSGKSTVAALLQRLYDPKEGHILFEGSSIKDWNIAHYRSLIGVVGQEPVLFDLTIEENIKYGFVRADGSEPTLEEVEEAARLANIHDFILSLPEQYKTRVGEMGSSLSGGQKQRVAIARALIRKPALLILDEATSALDSETENLVEEALVRASSRTSTLVIAHRLRSIQQADKIYVLQDGQVVEEGSPMELLNLQGLYYSMVQQQQLGSEAVLTE